MLCLLLPFPPTDQQEQSGSDIGRHNSSQSEGFADGMNELEAALPDEQDPLGPFIDTPDHPACLDEPHHLHQQEHEREQQQQEPSAGEPAAALGAGSGGGGGSDGGGPGAGLPLPLPCLEDEIAEALAAAEAAADAAVTAVPAAGVGQAGKGASIRPQLSQEIAEALTAAEAAADKAAAR